VRIRQKVGNPFPIAISLIGVARIIAEMGDKHNALNYAKLSIRYADSSGLLVTRTGALEQAAEIAASAEEYKDAYNYFKLYAELRDSVIMKEQRNDVRSLAQELEIERGKKEKSQLLQKQQEQQAMIRQQTIIAVSIGIVAVLLVIVIIAVVKAQRIASNKQLLAEQYSTTIEHTNQRLDEMNQALYEQNANLEQVNHEKEEILNIVVHDLKNPISAVHGLAELFQAGIVEPDQTAVVAEQIVHTSERMLELVMNLLDVSRLESGAMHFRAVGFDIVSMIDGTLMQYRVAANAKHITFQEEYQHEVMHALADEQAVMQVLDNLISNAVKYSPHGKQIFVRAVGRAVNSADVVRIEVQDEGEGISPEDMTRLFGKFARLSARPTGGEHSTGLGLSIVKQMVEAMNGRVWCESEAGKGATFIVELPTISP
jgi:signal transduction histidine kinase